MRALLAAALLTAGPAFAADSVGFLLGADHLSNGGSDWHEASLQYRHEFGKRHGLDLELARTERFNLRDRRFGVAYGVPLNERLVATVDASASDTHRVLAKHAFGTTLQFEFQPAWLLHAGAKTTRYNDARVNQGLVMLERYVSSFSWSVAWRPARAFDTTAHSGEVRGTYFYGERNSLGLLAAAGKEATSIAGRVALTDVRAVALIGRHWFHPEWAVNYAIGSTRQGDFYTRNGISLGLQHAF